MKVKINYDSNAPVSEIIDLEDYGFEKSKKWIDLTEEEQIMVTDSLAEQYLVTCFVE